MSKYIEIKQEGVEIGTVPTKEVTDILAGTVLYEGNGIYCDGSTAVTSVNSVVICNVSDFGTTYKRIRVFASTVYGRGCADIPLVADGSINNDNLRLYSGFLIPTGDNNAGASLNYIAKFNVRLYVETDNTIKLQVRDTGYFKMGMGSVTTTQYTNNTNVEVKVDYPSWNQRHNADYNIFKVVGFGY